MGLVSAGGTSGRSSSIANYLGRTHRFLGQRVWLWPIIALLGLGLIGWWVRAKVERALKTKMAGELQTILNADVRALKIWFKAQESTAVTLASDVRVRTATQQLVDLANQAGSTDSVLVFSPQLATLREILKPALQAHGYDGFMLANRDHRVLAMLENEVIGKKMTAYEEFLNAAFAGRPTICRPFASPLL